MLALKQPRMLLNWRTVVRRLATAWPPAHAHIPSRFSVDRRHESKPAPRPHERSPLTPTSLCRIMLCASRMTTGAIPCEQHGQRFLFDDGLLVRKWASCSTME